jgi:hypothetical protein
MLNICQKFAIEYDVKFDAIKINVQPISLDLKTSAAM